MVFDPLRKWLWENGYLKKPVNSKQDSHRLLDGGLIYVPENKERDFLSRYAKEMSNGTKLYYVEARPKIYKYMVDLDIGDDHFWSKEEIIKICTFIIKIVNEFYDGNFVGICCNTSTQKMKPRQDGTEFCHTGVHIIFPKLYVGDETALLLRRAILQKVESDYGYTSKETPWSDILDERIYVSNGFRMVGSDKMHREKNPNYRDGDDKKTKFIKVPESRCYLPFCVINGKGILRDAYLETLEQNYEKLMFETSIRYVPEAFKIANPEGSLPVKIPNWISGENILVKPKKKRKSYGNTSTGSKELTVLEYQIKKNIPEYRNEPTLIREAMRTPSGNLLVISHSHYCLNIGKEHGSNHVFFIVTPKYIYQKCLSHNSSVKGRKHGPCSEFISDGYKLPEDFSEVLFGKLEFRQTEEYHSKYDTNEPKNKKSVVKEVKQTPKEEPEIQKEVKQTPKVQEVVKEPEIQKEQEVKKVQKKSKPKREKRLNGSEKKKDNVVTVKVSENSEDLDENETVNISADLFRDDDDKPKVKKPKKRDPPKIQNPKKPKRVLIDGKCEVILATGSQCKGSKKEPTKYCGRHKDGQPKPKVKVKKVVPEEERCEMVLEDGIKCTARKKYDQQTEEFLKYCGRHKNGPKDPNKKTGHKKQPKNPHGQWVPGGLSRKNKIIEAKKAAGKIMSLLMDLDK
jgi:hypothetical protein